jgi:hypothetical protein
MFLLHGLSRTYRGFNARREPEKAKDDKRKLIEV